MQRLPQLSEYELADLHALRRSLEPGRSTRLSPANYTHRSALMNAFTHSGHTKEKFPHLHAGFASGGVHEQDLEDHVVLVDGGQTDDGKATATCWTTASGDTLIGAGSTFVFHPETGELLAHGQNSAVANGFLDCPTRSASAQTAPGALDVLHVACMIDRNSKQRFMALADTVMVGNGIQANVPVPTFSPKLPAHPNIEIAVGRKTGFFNKNSDYIYVNPVNVVSPYLICPFEGSVSLAANIDGGAITAGSFKTNIIKQNADASTYLIPRAKQYTTDAKLKNAFTANGNKLSWKFPFDGYVDQNNPGVSYDKTSSLVYDQSNLTSEKITYFFFSFDIPMQQGPNAVFYVCSKSSPEKKSKNCTQIENLMFWWHCAKEGTLVTLEDGSQVPIETIHDDQRVKTAQGGALAVVGTRHGLHQSKAGDVGPQAVFELRTECGRTLNASGCHMLKLAGGGYRRICDISTDDELITENGPSKVSQVVSIDSDDVYYSLGIGSHAEAQSDAFAHNDNTYFTNGIASADHETMIHHRDLVHEDLDFILPRISPELHVDYASALKAKRF